MSAAWPAGLFVACSLLILVSGTRLSRYGDVLAVETGIGGTWMGLVVMAAVTSLPELATGASSIVLHDLPDIAAGDAIGSCMFNLVILALLDFPNPVPLSARIHQGHVLSAAFGIVQLGLVALAMLAGPAAPVLGWMAVHSLFFLAVYLLAAHVIFVFERGRAADLAQAQAAAVAHRDVPVRRAAALYAINAAVLVGAAALLPGLAEDLATRTGLAHSVVGSLFVAASTSLPEVVVSIAAARIGAIDMAAANLFGSNLFNVAVIGFDDLLYVRGSLLLAVSPAHLLTLTAAILMTAVAIIGLTCRASRKRYRLSWDAIAILGIYIVGVGFLSRLE
jgi:cation:H+ antiporter